ncbi:MAG: RNA-binding domain-containing protein [Bacteroidota bacterium]
MENKASFNDSVIETLVAFANSKGGSVLIGINDDGSPNTNFTFGKETFQKWVNEIKVKTQPSIIPDIEVIVYNGQNIVELAIPEFPIKPVSFKGRYYKRVKNSNHQLSVIEIADLSLQSLQVSWDSYPAPNITIDDIDLLKVEKFIRKVNATGRFNLEGSLVENLEKLRLISNNKITNAAYLLFAKRDIAFNVHLGRFKTPSYIIDDKMLRGSLFEVVEETMKYLISQIKVAFEITGVTTQRTEIFEYPLPALRELVLNALIHRDYLSPIDVQIKVFDNSITFFNPGKLYGDLTVAHLISNNYQAYARNKLLAEAFYLTGDIEKYGSGFKRIQNELKQYPTMNMDCQEIPNGFLVELSYTQQKTTTRISTENSASAEISGQGAKSGTKSGTKDGTKDGTKKQIDSKMDLIIDLLKESKHVTIDNISKMLNIPRRTIVRYLEKLKNDNVIQRTGSKKDGYWEIL